MADRDAVDIPPRMNLHETANLTAELAGRLGPIDSQVAQLRTQLRGQQDTMDREFARVHRSLQRDEDEDSALRKRIGELEAIAKNADDRFSNALHQPLERLESRARERDDQTRQTVGTKVSKEDYRRDLADIGKRIDGLYSLVKWGALLVVGAVLGHVLKFAGITG